MADKDLDEMLGHLVGLVGSVHTAAAASGRARSADDVAAVAEEVLGVPATAHGSVADAVVAARHAGAQVLVAGSLYVAGEARTALGF